MYTRGVCAHASMRPFRYTANVLQDLKRFSATLASFAHQKYIARANFSNWIDLFEIFTDVPRDKTKILVIDEFQYLVNTNPDFCTISRLFC